MEFRKALKSDLENIMRIIKHGQEYLRDQGVNQWQDNYPNMEVIEMDIDKGYSYVVEEQNEIVATTALSFDGEITYEKIYEGSWISNQDYCVIHRMAIHKEKRGKGISYFMMESIDSICNINGIRSIKVDTHRDNLPMQQYLQKNGFKYCGVIYLSTGDERLAYERVLY